MALESDVKTKLEKIVGKGDVRDEDFILAAYAVDMTEVVPSKADVVVLPESREEVSAILKLATEKKIPVTPRASNTFGSGVGLANGGILLDLGKMDKIIKIDEDTMSVTAQAGCSANKIFQELKKRGFDLPLQPWFGPGPSIGSWVSATGTGGRIARYGQAKSWVLGLEVVLPTGEILQTGSGMCENCQPFWNWTSNLGLDQLFHRSYGTLGVITEVTAGMIPLPETTSSIAYGFDDMQCFIKAAYNIQRADAATDIEHEDGDLYNHLLEMSEPYPFVLCVTNQGYKEEVKRKTEIASRLCEEAGGYSLPSKFAETTWKNAATFDFRTAHFGRYAMIGGMCTYATYEKMYRIYKDTLDKYNIKNGWSAWSSWPAWVVGWVVAYYNPETQLEDLMKVKFEVMRKCIELPDFLPGPVREPYANVMTNIKNMLDPSDIMNHKAWEGPASGSLFKMLKNLPLPD